jgi:biopolymer transport protein ExbD
MGSDRGNVKSEINVTPLVDVCLVLLIIFMVVTPMLGTGSVTLPKTDDPSKKPEEKDQIVLLVEYANPPRYSIGDKNNLSKELFEKELDEQYQRTPNRQVVIKADKGLNWKAVKDVMKITKDAGFENVGLITEKKQQTVGR